MGQIRIGQGKDNSRIFLKDNPDIALEVEDKIKSHINGEDTSQKNRKSVSDVVDEQQPN